MDFRIKRCWTLALATAGALVALSARSAPYRLQVVKPDDAAFFEARVRPLLFEHCFACHGDQKQMGGLRLDSREALAKGAASGPVFMAGDPDNSRLIRAVQYTGAVRMPPAGKLKADEIAALAEWVRRGAPWPETPRAATEHAPAGPAAAPFVLTDAQKHFWSFQPVRKPAVPAVRNRAWVRSPIDAFILARLEKQGLTPAPPADRRILIRRATFDLTGLPPTPEEVRNFLADTTPGAFAKVVDRLLASPHYGERWGRHWLDVVRYCDSLDARGLGGEGDIPFAWRYRDWVVDAFNHDMPYTDFILNQVAGDILPPKEPGGINVPGTIATGFLAIGNWGNGDADKEKILTDIADDQVDVVSRGFMGLTVACARCHNHKFDPLSTQDYYGLAGIFFSTHILPKLTPKGAGETPLRIPLVSPKEMEQRSRIEKEIAALQKQLAGASEVAYRDFAKSMLPQTARYVAAAWDYAHPPAGQARLGLAGFASQRGLHAFALRQWVDALGMGDYRPMTIAVRDVLGNAGIHAWRGPADTPSLTVNTNNEARSFLTITLPPRSVAVHPGPNNGVAVCWHSPIAARVRISGRVVDADPNCGDGIAWIIDHRGMGAPSELASGQFENGGAQAFDQGQNGARLTSVAVQPGDRIDLLVLPKANHACDTTVVELTIAQAGISAPDVGAGLAPPSRGGGRVWNLTRDILDDLHRGNPHPDRYGNPGVWEFDDMASSHRAVPADEKSQPLLAQWQRATAALPSRPPDAAAIEAAARAFAGGFHQIDQASPFWIQDRRDEASLPPDLREALANREAELAAKQKAMPPPSQYANGAQEGGCPESPQTGFHDVRVHIRGRYDRLAELVPRRFPVVLAGEHQPPITKGSGRLELARWLAGPHHPLTARVMVNRIWQHHFGAGIVRTPSNFGFLGERPTHPELLDWLAWQFMHDGWSIKKMHRLILLSATYQQSSIPPARTAQIDPDNRLLGHMSRRRLESEELRDSLLRVAGRLDPTMGGPANRPFITPRRTLYIMTIRSDRSGFGPLFDSADSTAQVDRRTVSTVAPQALFLLNDPFVLEQTKWLARHLLADRKADDAARIVNAYLLLYARPPSTEEVRIGLDYLNRARLNTTARVAGPGAPNLRERAWIEYCQILLCANEFMYVD